MKGLERTIELVGQARRHLSRLHELGEASEGTRPELVCLSNIQMTLEEAIKEGGITEGSTQQAEYISR